MLRLILWGTGSVAEKILNDCRTINAYTIVGFIDNDNSKHGKKFHNKIVYSPDVLRNAEIDVVVVLTDSYEEIVEQILKRYPNLNAKIDNKYFFYKESILKRYKNETNQDMITVLSHIKKHGLAVFNYPFAQKYESIDIPVYHDAGRDLFYVLQNGKRMYMSRRFNNRKDVEKYYRSILVEQDVESPHRYVIDGYDVQDGTLLVDVGCAEGNFTLSVIEKVKKAILIECDEYWIEALQYTFEKYMDKVKIIKGMASSYNEGDFVTLDSIISEEVNYIKMDIEGAEYEALRGAQRIINESRNLTMSICTYHSDFAYDLMEGFMQRHHIRCEPSRGFIWYPYTVGQNHVSTQLNRGLIRCRK